MNKPGGLILLYHRVTALETDPQLLAVTPENFAAQLEMLKKMARPLRLGEMVEAAQRGEDLAGTVAITFDDGYADNLLQAEPILRSVEIPATVFVASGGTGSDREFFWDELDRIFLQPNELPRHFELELGGVSYHADLGDSAGYSRDRFEELRNWNVTLAADPSARQRVYRELCGLIHKLTATEREAVLSKVQKWSALTHQGRRSHRMMNQDELRAVIQGGWIEAGGHTVRHPLLAAETLQTQEDEIARGKAQVESAVGKTIVAFSYPFGTRRDYIGQTVEAVKAAGFHYACSNFNGLVTSETDCFQLPRVIVRDWGAAEFLKRLQLIQAAR